MITAEEATDIVICNKQKRKDIVINYIKSCEDLTKIFSHIELIIRNCATNSHNYAVLDIRKLRKEYLFHTDIVVSLLEDLGYVVQVTDSVFTGIPLYIKITWSNH